MVRQVKRRNHIIYVDTDLNTWETVYLNIYQEYVSMAMKMHGYIRTWGIDAARSTTFIKCIYWINFFTCHWELMQYIAIIYNVIHETYICIRRCARSKMAETFNANCNVQKAAVIWYRVYICRCESVCLT